MDANLTYREKAWRQLLKNAARNTEQILEVILHKKAGIQQPTTRYENYPS